MSARRNPDGSNYRSRRLLNQEFIQALLLHFRNEGKRAIQRVAREHPAAYVKILALLVPREMKFEHTNAISVKLRACYENLTTARALGLTVPKLFLLRALLFSGEALRETTANSIAFVRGRWRVCGPPLQVLVDQSARPLGVVAAEGPFAQRSIKLAIICWRPAIGLALAYPYPVDPKAIA